MGRGFNHDRLSSRFLGAHMDTGRLMGDSHGLLWNVYFVDDMREKGVGVR